MKILCAVAFAFATFVSASAALPPAGTVHFDHPTYPNTGLPFAVNEENVRQHGGDGSWSDEASSVCFALGLGLAVGPFDSDFSPLDTTAVRIYAPAGAVQLYDVMGPHDLPTAGYVTIGQIDCRPSPEPMPRQKLGYFSADSVQALLRSAMPVRFDVDPVPSAADVFCQNQGYDRAGEINTSWGTADEKQSTQTLEYSVDANGILYATHSTIGYPQGVVCSDPTPYP